MIKIRIKISKNIEKLLFSAFLFLLSFNYNLHAQEIRNTGLPANKVESLQKYYKANPAFPTTGVEVEGIIPEEIGLEGMHKVLLKELIREFPDIKMKSEDLTNTIRTGEVRLIKEVSYSVGRSENTKTQKNSSNNKAAKTSKSSPPTEYAWRVREDGSIKPPKGYEGAEINSPIMRDSEDRERFYRMIESWEKLGMRPEISSAGIHVHVGFKRAHISEILLLVKAFSLVEVELIDFFEVKNTRRHFAEITPDSILEDIDKNFDQKPSNSSKGQSLNTIESFGKFNSNLRKYKDFIENHYEYKYWALNLKSLFTFGTVEFRIWNSTMDVNEIKTMVEFATKLVHSIRSKDPAIMEFIKNPPPKSKALSGLINALKMNKMGQKRCRGFIYNSLAS